MPGRGGIVGTGGESPGYSFIVEAKKLEAGALFQNFGMQFSAKAIVSSFVECNLHQNLNPTVPSLHCSMLEKILC